MIAEGWRREVVEGIQVFLFSFLLLLENFCLERLLNIFLFSFKRVKG